MWMLSASHRSLSRICCIYTWNRGWNQSFGRVRPDDRRPSIHIDEVNHAGCNNSIVNNEDITITFSITLISCGSIRCYRICQRHCDNTLGGRILTRCRVLLFSAVLVDGMFLKLSESNRLDKCFFRQASAHSATFYTQLNLTGYLLVAQSSTSPICIYKPEAKYRSH